MFGEHLGEPPDEPPGCLVAGAGDHLRVVQHLFACELSPHAVLVVELDVEQRRHQIVGGILGAPVDVVGVDTAVRDRIGLDHFHRRAGPGAEVGIVGVANADLFILGDAHQHADDAHRHHRGEVGDDVETVRPDQRIEAADAELPNLVLDLGHPPRREDP